MNDELQAELREAYQGLHEIVLTDIDLLWLIGHTAYADGIGAGLYMKLRALAKRDGLVNEPRTTDRIAELVADRSNKVVWR